MSSVGYVFVLRGRCDLFVLIVYFEVDGYDDDLRDWLDEMEGEGGNFIIKMYCGFDKGVCLDWSVELSIRK